MNREKLIGKDDGDIIRCPVGIVTELVFDLIKSLLEYSTKEGNSPV